MYPYVSSTGTGWTSLSWVTVCSTFSWWTICTWRSLWTWISLWYVVSVFLFSFQMTVPPTLAFAHSITLLSLSLSPPPLPPSLSSPPPLPSILVLPAVLFLPVVQLGPALLGLPVFLLVLVFHHYQVVLAGPEKKRKIPQYCIIQKISNKHK